MIRSDVRVSNGLLAPVNKPRRVVWEFLPHEPRSEEDDITPASTRGLLVRSAVHSFCQWHFINVQLSSVPGSITSISLSVFPGYDLPNTN